MLISIRHLSRYSYAEPVGYTIQSLRLTPASFEGQRVLDWRVTGGAGMAAAVHGRLRQPRRSRCYQCPATRS